MKTKDQETPVVIISVEGGIVQNVLSTSIQRGRRTGGTMNATPIFTIDTPLGSPESRGYCVPLRSTVAAIRVWLSQEGQVTDQWDKRGLWATASEANAALERFMQ